MTLNFCYSFIIIILPPPCFSVGRVYWGSNYLFSFDSKIGLFSNPLGSNDDISQRIQTFTSSLWQQFLLPGNPPKESFFSLLIVSTYHFSKKYILEFHLLFFGVFFFYSLTIRSSSLVIRGLFLCGTFSVFLWVLKYWTALTILLEIFSDLKIGLPIVAHINNNDSRTFVTRFVSARFIPS